MKVLVLGGNGFIGSHVVDALLTAGHQVRVFDRAEDKYRGRISTVEYVLGTFDDALLLTEALTDIDVVFHGISTTVPSTSNADPIADIQSNLVSTVRLFKAMLDKGVERIVFLSSGGTVYGQVKVDLISEEHPLHPVCSYGIVKVAIENYLFMYQELHGIKPIVLRGSNPYGERQGHLGVQGVIGTFLNKIAKNERIEIWGDGTIVRDFIYVGDLAQACLKAIICNDIGVFNIGGGIGHSINEVFECAKLVSTSSIVPVYKPARGFDVQRVVLDIAQAKAIFKWHPKTSLFQGMAETWRWIQDQQR
jgi:UDP-glucose 4-epimerase